MSVTTTDAPKSRIDWTQPVLWLFAIVMVALILPPLSWLAVYRLTDKVGHFTLSNFTTLFSDPDFLDPLLITAIIAISSARSAAASRFPSAGWCHAPTCRDGRASERW